MFPCKWGGMGAGTGPGWGAPAGGRDGGHSRGRMEPAAGLPAPAAAGWQGAAGQAQWLGSCCPCVKKFNS